MTDKIEVENINIPGQVSKVDRVKYENVRAFMLAILPATAPGLTHKEIMTAAKLELDQSLFPDGRKSGWWTKSDTWNNHRVAKRTERPKASSSSRTVSICLNPCSIRIS